MQHCPLGCCIASSDGAGSAVWLQQLLVKHSGRDDFPAEQATCRGEGGRIRKVEIQKVTF